MVHGGGKDARERDTGQGEGDEEMRTGYDGRKGNSAMKRR